MRQKTVHLPCTVFVDHWVLSAGTQEGHEHTYAVNGEVYCRDHKEQHEPGGNLYLGDIAAERVCAAVCGNAVGNDMDRAFCGGGKLFRAEDHEREPEYRGKKRDKEIGFDQPRGECGNIGIGIVHPRGNKQQERKTDDRVCRKRGKRAPVKAPFGIAHRFLCAYKAGNLFGKGFGLDRGCHNALHAVGGGDGVHIADKAFERGNVIAADFECAVYENFGDIVIAGEHSANEAVKLFRAVDTVFLCVDKAGVVLNIKGELSAVFDADNDPVRNLCRGVDFIDKSFGFACSFYSDYELHKYTPFFRQWDLFAKRAFAGNARFGIG